MIAAGSFGGLASKRRRLAAELLRIRDQGGVSGRELARRIGISQSKVSRIEAGRTTPSIPEVMAWADALGTTGELRAELQNLTEAAYVEVHAWRTLLRGRSHLQLAVGHREATARRIRTFQPSIVPGLLQTADYAARVFSMFQLPYATNDAAAALAGRLDRQAVLHQGGRFEFLITELALRWRPGPNRLLIGQLERLLTLSTTESISIGVIGLDAEATAAIPHGFVIYDNAEDDFTYVTLETVHAEVDVTEPVDVALYEEQWSYLDEMAVFGDAVHQLIAKFLSDLRGRR